MKPAPTLPLHVVAAGLGISVSDGPGPPTEAGSKVVDTTSAAVDDCEGRTSGVPMRAGSVTSRLSSEIDA